MPNFWSSEANGVLITVFGVTDPADRGVVIVAEPLQARGIWSQSFATMEHS